MIITAGTAKGRSIKAPAGLSVRPTASKVRQALFNILSNKVTGARFLDICAGTGLVGLEALSRGACALVCLEENRQMAKAIENNLVSMHFTAKILADDFRKILPQLEPESFDLIFADPPYGKDLVESVLSIVGRHHLLAADGILIVEHGRAVKCTQALSLLRQIDYREYGQTALTFFQNC